jgi:hypothetical protein
MNNSVSISFPHKQHEYQFNFSLTRNEKFRDRAEAQTWFNQFLKCFFSDHPEIHPKQITKINADGVVLLNGRTISHPILMPKLDGSVRKTSYLWKTLPVISRSYPLVVNQTEINKPEQQEIEPGIARADYQFLDPVKHSHTLDSIEPKTRWDLGKWSMSKQAIIELETAFLAQQARDRGKSPTKTKLTETRFGVGLGVDRRCNYRMTVHLDQPLQQFFRKTTFISDEIFAKNSRLNGVLVQDGPISGAITSSFNRLADTVSLLRKVEAEDGSSDCYAGRVDTEEKAEELAQFIFLGEIDSFENKSGLSKGICLQKDGSYQLTFSVQSLLSMSKILSADQRCKYYQQAKNYQKLIEKTKEHPLLIKHPKTGKVYRVVINPILPIASNQFNFITRIESFGFGKNSALAESQKGDAQLADLAKQKIQELKEKDPDRVLRIQSALKSLQNKKLNAWQIVMIRSYLCHLLEIPQVVHCLSSVDRTGGVAIPMIAAMKQWLRSKRPLPSSIIDIVKTPLELPNHSIIYPFKHLFYYKMLHELKVTEFSRGVKGFKLDELGPFHIVHPLCRELLPEACFHRGKLKDNWAWQGKRVRNRKLIYTKVPIAKP